MLIKGTSGFAQMFGPYGVQKSDTFTCNHCNSVVHVDWGQREFTRCAMCDRLICQKCRGKGCEPFEKRLEEQIKVMERRQRLRREMGLIK